MKNIFDDVVKVLNELIETNFDRIKGYKKAEEDAEEIEIKSLCSTYASQSNNFKGELEQLVKEYGGEPKASSSASGDVYRAWMGIKHAATGHDKKSVLSSCEFGEDAAKKSYEDASSDAAGFPDNVKFTINNQLVEIVKAHDRVRAMRDALIEH